jgi:CheY-like chemotaxis protein
MSKRVLLVDDIDFILEFEEKVIQSLEDELGTIKVDKANTVAEAYRFVSGFDYDVVIVDMNLPDGTGTDIAKHVLEKNKNTRVAALTIYPERYESERAYFDAYFKKPVLPSVYKENLKLLLR